MRNLINIGHRRAALLDASDLPPSATAWDIATDSLICAFGPTEDSPIIELKRLRYQDRQDTQKVVVESITSWDAPCPLPELDCDEILSLQWFSDTSTACLVLAGGDLVIVRENPLPEQDRIEIVGSVDVGISAAAWSPDEELLALVTRSDTFLFMAREFENVSDVTFSPEDVSASKHVSVGWGKKETQFQGKRAKALRDPTMPETTDEGKLSDQDNGRTTISWRGDGAFVAVNSVILDQRRLIRVFSREGVLDGASEPVDGLEGALSWRPAGNLMAAVQRKADSVDVVFFERNGLRHGQFSLRLSPDDMSSWARDIQLSWNPDSTVLAVSYTDRLQLWTMGNYHYYLKQEVMLGERSTSLATLRWHPEEPRRICVLEESYLTALEYIFDVSGGSVVQPNDTGSTSVIDGKTLKFTPLKLAGVPPPMALFDITVDEPIRDTSFSLTASTISILTRRGIYLYSWDSKSRPPVAPQLIEVIEHDSMSSDVVYRHVVARGEDEVYVSWDVADSHSQIGCSTREGNGHWSSITELSSKESSLVRLVTDIQRSSVWGHYTDKLVPLTSEVDDFSAPADRTLGDLPWLSIAQLDLNNGLEGISNGYAVNGEQSTVMRFGLSRKGELFANSRVLAKNCTSFLVTPAHLVFTTSQHLLKFVHITSESDLEVPADTPEVDERCRAIERGAKLVAVTPSNYAVTLQMPRGNLETIYPRAIVLAGIRQHIDNKDYKLAYTACRNHQVDTNILCDYRFEQFMDNVPLFINQLKKASRLDDFLSKLRDEDVSQTLYRDTLKLQVTGIAMNATMSLDPQQPKPAAKSPVTGKTNRVCDAFLSSLAVEPSGRTQNVITAHVSKLPPDLESGLRLVSKLRETSIEEADAAMVHLCFLSDVNRLYEVALSLYDIPLTLLVAEQSQKDPREYMPFLERLHAIPQEARRKFEIDNHLRKYAKALSALYELAVHDELEQYCVRHSLYTQTLALYKHEPAPQPRMKRLSVLFAEYLVSQSRNRQAAIIYESLSDYQSAYPLYALSHMWRESLACASLVSIDDEKRKEHALSLATTLAEEDRDYRSAATIHSEHLLDHLTAARLLCRGSYFGDGTRILALHGLGDEIQTIIDTGLTEKFGEILELLADCKSQFSKQVPRIEELRIKKAEDPLAFFGGEANMDAGMAGDVPDNVSIAQTNASTTGGQSLFTKYGSSKGAGTVMSTSSRKTSKTRRKEERKRAMGKKGSVYEEEYLVGSVGRLIERVNTALEEIRRLGEGLLRRGMRERAEVLEETVKGLLELSNDSVGRVWVKEAKPDVQEEHDRTGEGRPGGGEGVLWDSQQENAMPFKEAPTLKEWKPLEG